MQAGSELSGGLGRPRITGKLSTENDEVRHGNAKIVVS